MSNSVIPASTRVAHAQSVVARWLAARSIDLLRISLGSVFLGFGALKFPPGVSPAEGLSVRTIDALTLDLVTGDAARIGTALTETFIGVTLLTGRCLRAGLLVLAVALIGIMSPLVLFSTDLFAGGPTLEAQYVLKDVVLVAAAMVVAAHALGARLRDDG